MRSAIRVLAELTVTAGLILALLVAHLVWGTGDYTRRQQKSLSNELEQQWQATRSRLATSRDRQTTRSANPAPRAIGHAFAVIRVPRFGPSYRYAIVEGVTASDLRKGPGHYPGTAGPGEVGNMVISGHRTTYGAPFNRNGELSRGDQILIDTATTTYAYTVTGRTVVRPDAIQVTAPVPLHPDSRPRRRLLTLTTCHPKFSAAYRLIVFAELKATYPANGSL
ncbi:class E sortase [Actinomadura barringtoniae]|uniref:Class E sortase n=1 Tax=Actinomadura barringtoniae TaxID=1427535 RepID=A0A939PEQ7_9ACTN|nr:class E sortase [Actinomadura barringtoniae]MBO2447859.1 class E sortase [Actinomadura barringtoniae]